MFTSLEHLCGHIIELGLDLLCVQIFDLGKGFSGRLRQSKVTGIHQSRELVSAGNVLDTSHHRLCPRRSARRSTGFFGLLRF